MALKIVFSHQDVSQNPLWHAHVLTVPKMPQSFPYRMPLIYTRTPQFILCLTRRKHLESSEQYRDSVHRAEINA